MHFRMNICKARMIQLGCKNYGGSTMESVLLHLALLSCWCTVFLCITELCIALSGC